MMMKHLLFFLFLAPAWLFSQCPDVEAATSMGPLQYQSRGEHCEGFYRSRVSANDLSLVSFTKGPLRYSADEAVNLKLSVPASVQAPINVRGYGIPRDLYYRMDLQLQAGEAFNWNTGTVLLKNPRTKYSRFVGLLGLTEQQVFVPVIVGKPSAEQPYLMQLVSSTRITKVKWRIPGHTEFRELNNGRSFRADKAIRVALPKDLKPGQYTFEIQGKDANDGITTIARSIAFKI